MKERCYLQDCGETRKWLEWIEQSGNLFWQWVKETLLNGYKGSPTATICATTPFGVRDIFDSLPTQQLNDGDIIYEIGGALGPLAQEFLRNIRKNIQYHIVDVNKGFIEHLNGKVKDPRLHTHHMSGENLQDLVERFGKGKMVLSSMPFSHDEELSKKIITSIRDEVLVDNGVFTMWNFTRRSIELVIKLFQEEHCTLRSSKLNIPPLKIITAVRAPHLSLPVLPRMTEKTVINRRSAG